MRCKHARKKSISMACWPTLRSSPAILPSSAPLAWSGKGLACRLPELALPAMQIVRTDLQPASTSAMEAPDLQPPNRLQLKLPGELPARNSHDSILHSLKIMPYSPVSFSGSTPNCASECDACTNADGWRNKLSRDAPICGRSFGECLALSARPTKFTLVLDESFLRF